MKYKPTQIYLPAEDHAALKAEAERRGISLAALLRELAAAHVHEGSPAYETKSWDALVIESSRTTNVAEEIDAYTADTLDALYEKKMGTKAPAPRPRKKK